MAFMMIIAAIFIAVALLFFFIISAQQSSSYSINRVDVDWSAIKDSELQSYLPNGKINAIKRYRELTSVGLKEAKLAVEYAIANPDAKKGKRALSANTDGAGVKDLLLEGRFEEAVDVYSAFMGVDEYTARSAITELQRDLTAEANLSDDLDMNTIQDLLEAGKKIEAIKHYREQMGTDLATAKRAIDELE